MPEKMPWTENTVDISGTGDDFLKGKGAGRVHPASDHTLITDTSAPVIRPNDGPPAAAVPAEETAEKTGVNPEPEKGKAARAGKGPRHAKRKTGPAAAKPGASTEGQDAETEDAAGAAKEKAPQDAGPPEASAGVPQAGAKKTTAPEAPGSAPQSGAEKIAPSDASDPPVTSDSSDTGQAAQADETQSVKKLLANAPTLEQLEKELKKERRRVDFGRVLRNTIFSLVVVAAVSALIAVLFLPVLQIHGSSMSPTFSEQDIVAAFSVGSCKQGDLIAFYYNNNILVKRVIAGPGDWVDIDEEGNVSVNGQPLEEPYLAEKARGNCDITFPYQVPDARYFVMGDQRSTSVDSRSELVGCVSREMIIGRIFIRVWPIETIRLF